MQKVTTGETLSVTTPIGVDEELTVEQQTTAPLKLMESEMALPQSEDEAADQAVEQALLAAEVEEAAMEQSVVQQQVPESPSSDSESGPESSPLTVAPEESSPPLDATSNVAEESEAGGETAAAEEASAVEEAVDVRGRSLALLSYRRFMRALFIQSPVRP